MITKTVMFPTRVVGDTRISNGTRRIKHDGIPTVFGSEPAGHDSLPTRNFGATLLARSNPSRSKVDLPVALYELRELPMLVKGYGDGLLKAVANGNLSWQFAIKPMISDARSLFDIQDIVNKRVKELNKVFSDSGKRYRVKLGVDTGENLTAVRTVQSTPSSCFIRGVTLTQTTAEYWGTVRWKATVPRPVDPDDVRRLALASSLGLGLDPATFVSHVWNAMPWSWLVDWFGNVGDFINAHRNTVPAEHLNACIMCTKVTKAKQIVTQLSPANYTNESVVVIPGGWIHTTKSREVVASPTLSADVPFLDARRASIIASLAVLMGRTKFRL
ncbi:MAG: putative maturation protein [Leviviridae sp.]|nr:MAG: putative maturation protein [Leviviridae sp.]